MEISVYTNPLHVNTIRATLSLVTKIPKNYRIDAEIDSMIRNEAVRRTAANGGKPKISDAEVIEMAVREFVASGPLATSRQMDRIAGQIKPRHIGSVDAVGPAVESLRGKVSIETFKRPMRQKGDKTR